MSKPADKVRDHYQNDPEREWDRLQRHPFELPVTLHYLRRFLRPDSRILDNGGGPGRYAIELARDGHQVELLDLAPANVEMARTQAARAGVVLSGYHEGTATDLSAFEPASFDAVLCLGPLYHLTDPEERSRAIREASRVLRPGGILAVAFITVYGPLFDLVRRFPERIDERLEAISSWMLGPGRAVTDEPGFTDAWFVQPDEVEPWMAQFNLEPLAFLGVEGAFSQSEGPLSAAGEAILAGWIELAIRIAETPAARHGSDHLLWIGRKPQD